MELKIHLLPLHVIWRGRGLCTLSGSVESREELDGRRRSETELGSVSELQSLVIQTLW